MSSSKLLLTIRTVRHLQPSQIWWRLRGQRALAHAKDLVGHKFCSIGCAIPELDADPAYCTRFDIDALARDEFLLINERHSVDLQTWHADDASHLWNFNLHYMEYLVALANRYRRAHDEADYALFKRLVSSWIDACSYPAGGHLDAWHPYTISLRLINWLIALDAFREPVQRDTAFWERMQSSAYLQYRHLLANQERHLLANHYWDNLKTLLIMALVFDEPKVFKRIWGDFERQLKVQVLSDGFHFERSPMYHNLMLESLLRLIVALRGAQRANEAERIEDVACSMWGAMLSLERGLSKMPAFNDSADGVAKDCRALDKACRRLMGAKPRIAPYLADAGYARLECGRLVALFDAGDPTNEYSTGHAHCDELSYELYLDGEPFVVNAGTYAYQSELRPYFRSTAAHNTAQYEACEQHECWAEHRVARRGHRGVAPKVSQTKVFASFVSYEGHCHERRFAVGDRGVNVQDSFPLERKGNVSSYIHFAPGLSLKPLDDGRFFVCNASDEEVALLSLEAGESAEVVFDYVPVSREMGRLEQSLRVAFRAKAYGVSYSISFEVKGLE